MIHTCSYSPPRVVCDAVSKQLSMCIFLVLTITNQRQLYQGPRYLCHLADTHDTSSTCVLRAGVDCFSPMSSRGSPQGPIAGARNRDGCVPNVSVCAKGSALSPVW